MANYLITGARAPAALELSRNLARHGHRVYCADSLAFPIAKFSNSVRSFSRITSPHEGVSKYCTDLLKIIEEENISHLLPTCEEVFYVAKIKPQLETHCHVICPELQILRQLHSKSDIFLLAEECGISAPRSRLLPTTEVLESRSFSNLVVKAEYGRFGTRVLLEPNRSSVEKLQSAGIDQLVVQEKISGEEICTYSIANAGKLSAHVSYLPTYKTGGTAGIYFTPYANSDITKFVSNFIERYGISGQIGFDFIKQGNQLFLLECNPRTTSGVHLMRDLDIASCIDGTMQAIDPRQTKPKMIASAVFAYSVQQHQPTRNLRSLVRHFRNADDVVYSHTDKRPAIYQILSLLEIAVLSLRKKKTVKMASTADIEWDGGEIL